jgi:hypothetical protein
MRASTIYFNTMKFVWMKLLLGMGVVFIAGVLFVPFFFIGMMFEFSVFIILMLVWLSSAYGIKVLVAHYFGYMVKAGHVAVITESMIHGKIPEHYFAFGLQRVKERFVSSSAFFLVDQLISGAVRQIQSQMERLGGWLNGVPGIGFFIQILNLFISISLNYIDECCLGYTFYKNSENTFKSAADGVVIYAQNWKTILKNAAMTTALVLMLMVGVMISLFLGFSVLFSAINISAGFAIIPAVFTTIVIKYAFIDSWILVKTMCIYMELAPQTTISFDLYAKLSKFSTQFKKLYQQGAVDDEPIGDMQSMSQI